MIKPETDLELSIKALEVYDVAPYLIENMLSNLNKLGTCWIPIEEAQPKPRQRVYVVCETAYTGGVVRFQTMAEYIPYMTVKEEDYMDESYAGDGDYNEDEDEYYTPEGFYEWQSEPDTNWKISAKVTHWMPLIALP